MNIPAPKANLSSSVFQAGAKSIQTNKLSISSVKEAQKTSSTDSNSTSKSTIDQGEVAKSTATEAQAFSTSLPGTGLLGRISNANTIKPPGSARSNINDTRNNANDIAAFQAMLKGSQETAKSIADGIARAFSAFGAIGQTSFIAAQKNKDGNGGGEQAASGKQSSQQQHSAQQQQSSQQQQQMYAQNDAQGQGGGRA